MFLSSAPFCVSVLRVIILSGIVAANPSILPFIEFSFRGSLFWLVVLSTAFVYIKASISNPGVLKTCPSELVKSMDAAGILSTVTPKDLKVDEADSPGSDSVKLGRRMIRKKRTKGGRYHQVESADSSDVDHASHASHARHANHPRHATRDPHTQHDSFPTRQRNRQQAKRKRWEEKALRGRLDSLSSNRSKAEGPIDQRTWDMIDGSGTEDSWSYCSEDRPKNVVVDFGKDSDGNDSYIGASSDGGSDTDSDDSDKIVSRPTNIKKTIIHDSQHPPPMPKSSTREIELSAFPSANPPESTTFKLPHRNTNHNDINHNSHSHPTNPTIAKSTSLEPIPPAIIPSSTTTSPQHTQDKALSSDDGLYPSASTKLWSDMLHSTHQHWPSRDARHRRLSHEYMRCPNTWTFLKKSLGQEIDATPSATVGAALEYAVSASASVPFAVVGIAACQIGNRARGVLGQDNELTRACQTINRQMRKSKTEDEVEEHDIEAALSQDENNRTTLRSRPPPIAEKRVSVEPTTPDPGSPRPKPISVPRSTPPSLQSQSKLNSKSIQVSQSTENGNFLNYRSVLGRTSDGLPCQSKIKLRFCRVCKKFQPLRTKHCSDCGFCVRTMDHHCPWLGSCVGEGNRVWFFWFLILQSIELTWAMIEAGRAFVSIRVAVEAEINIGRVIFLNIYLVLCFIVMLFLVIMVACLISYHLFLAASNLTTWENIAWNHITYLKDLPEKKGSPFSKGVYSNLYVYCCPPTTSAFLSGLFASWKTVQHGPENEIIWEHGEQQDACCCCGSDCCGCCSDC